MLCRRFMKQTIGCLHFANDDAKQRILPGRSGGRLFVHVSTESWSVVHAVLISFLWRSDQSAIPGKAKKAPFVTKRRQYDRM